MIIRIRKNEKLQYICLLLALMYAYFPRSIFARYLFGSVTLYLFYLAIFGCYVSTIIRRIRYLMKQPYKAAICLWTLAFLTIVAFGCTKTHDWNALIRYLIVFLLPLVVPPNIVLNRNWYKLFVFMGLFVTIGCLFSFSLPALYRQYIVPMFRGNDYESILNILRLNVNSGFISQTGYAAFFICIAIGALYSFKPFVRGNLRFSFLLFVLLAGLMITDKRGPAIMCMLTCAFLYYIEGKASKRIERAFYIILAAVLLYGLLSVLVIIGPDIPGIERLYSSIGSLLGKGELDDNGRAQLYTQAIEYFFNHPIIGIGWMNYKNIFILRGTHVHNIYLQLLCETGIVGFTIYASFFIVNLVRTCKMVKWHQKSTDICKAWVKFSLFVQVFFLLYGLTGNPLYDIENAVFYFMAIGIGDAAYSASRRRTNNEDSHSNIPVCA